MRIRDRELLIRQMHYRDMSGARLARSSECSRQFISFLCTGKKTTCTPKLARLIEEALDVAPGTLFVESKSCDSGLQVTSRATAA